MAGGDLVAEVADGLRARADPDQAGVDDRLREIGVLRKESVAGVDRVGAGFGSRVEQLAEVEVGLRGGLAAERERLIGEPDVWGVGVGFGVHGHARDPGVLGRADHPDGDLAAIGYQHFLDASSWRDWALRLLIGRYLRIVFKNVSRAV